jgi:hypothetical protein
MSLTRPSLASVLLLSFCTFSEAWVLHRKSASRAQDAKNVAPVELRRNHAQADTLEKRQETELYCPDDRWQEFLNSNPENRIETFCNEWLGIAPATTVLEYTPTMYVSYSKGTWLRVHTVQHNHDQRGHSDYCYIDHTDIDELDHNGHRYHDPRTTSTSGGQHRCCSCRRHHQLRD